MSNRAMGFPVLHRSSSCVHAVATTPAESTSAYFARFPVNLSLPRFLERVGFRITLFEASSAFTHVTACILAKPLTGPTTPKASAASLPPRLLRLLPAGAKAAGWGSHPLKDRALHGAPRTAGHTDKQRASPLLPLRSGRSPLQRSARSTRSVVPGYRARPNPQGLPIPMPRKPPHHGGGWTASDDKKLAKLRAAGASGSAMARALGRTRSSIYQHLSVRRRRTRWTR